MHNFDKIIHSTTHTKERTYSVLHRHWFDLASRFIVAILFLILITVSAIYAAAIMENANTPEIIPAIYFGTALLYLITWLYSFFVWVDYFLDIWIITSARVINVEQKGFFARSTSELDYTHIQDVESEIQGIIQTLFNYGDVYVQTAGSQGKFMFRHVGRPEKIKTLIMHLNRQAISKRAHPEAIKKEKSDHDIAYN
jgi:uncharacterized membrane protein YdbT with pleckstrin-like domain